MMKGNLLLFLVIVPKPAFKSQLFYIKIIWIFLIFNQEHHFKTLITLIFAAHLISGKAYDFYLIRFNVDQKSN